MAEEDHIQPWIPRSYRPDYPACISTCWRWGHQDAGHVRWLQAAACSTAASDCIHLDTDSHHIHNAEGYKGAKDHSVKRHLYPKTWPGSRKGLSAAQQPTPCSMNQLLTRGCWCGFDPKLNTSQRTEFKQFQNGALRRGNSITSNSQEGSGKNGT